MPSFFNLVSGHWYRFDRYVIEEGVIRPAPDAQGGWYDPWADRPARSRDASAPYLSLVELTDRARAGAAGSDNQITAWCATHGLLGILHGGSLATVPAPHAESEDSELDQAWKEWTLSRLFFWRHEPWLYPHPRSAEVWRSYGEPIDDFMSGAEALRGALNGLANLGRQAGSPQGERAQRRNISEGWRGLNKLLSVINPTLQFNDDQKPQIEWEAPSLLAHFALMVLFDVTQDRRLYRCTACNRIAVAKSHTAEYCSDRCRERMQKRRSRARHPA
jgi:hypothetical protein